MISINKKNITEHFKNYGFTEFWIDTVKQGNEYKLTVYKHHTNAMMGLSRYFNVSETGTGLEFPRILILTGK